MLISVRSQGRCLGLSYTQLVTKARLHFWGVIFRTAFSRLLGATAPPNTMREKKWGNNVYHRRFVLARGVSSYSLRVARGGGRPVRPAQWGFLSSLNFLFSSFFVPRPENLQVGIRQLRRLQGDQITSPHLTSESRLKSPSASRYTSLKDGTDPYRETWPTHRFETER